MGVNKPSSDFNKEDKSGGPVSYLAGKRQQEGEGVTYTHGKLPLPGTPGKHHKQSKNAGVGGKSYRGHGSTGYPTKTSA